ncbi:MAG: DNA mismatch repair protein MutS [Lachnospiraceae bacterium]|nr:DNA mismatch repair protein MutS [Lachnospiraceae bacterium]
MMRQYLETRAAYPDCILFYRLGDFYEMFFDDALTVSRELELTLTGKACGLEERAPMCGVPFHASESYLTKLVSRGYKVAIGEQVEDPRLAKGLVKREVIRVVTPGTNLNMQSLDESRHNYIMCVCYQSDVSGLSFCDMTTGDFLVTEVEDLQRVRDEILRFMPSEIVSNEAFALSGIDFSELKDICGAVHFTLENANFDVKNCRRILTRHFRVTSAASLGIDRFEAGLPAAGALLAYMQSVSHSNLRNVTRLYPYLPGRYMLLDAASRRNLELTETLRDKSKRGSLLWVLDHTRTAMGARRLREFVEQPLREIDEMRLRLDAVETMKNHVIPREEIREYLKAVYDLERLMARITFHSANARDLLAFGQSIRMLPALKTVLEEMDGDPALAALNEQIDPLSDLCALIDAAIDEEAPLTLREGAIIKDRFDADVDRLREADLNGKQWLLDLEEEMRAKTGIRTLRIKYSNNFGYAFEVSNSFKDMVPPDFVRRQTLTNCERYTTGRLKELEDTILHAREKLHGLEYELFCRVRDSVADEILRIQKTAQAVSYIDAYASLAYVAEKYGYVKPELSEDTHIDIRDGRHPVVERMLSDTEGFIANDTQLDTKDMSCMIITGPNMAGKSTYMRQTALILLMAQIGSFVPAKSARIGITDRIFTRVGASDDLAGGRSTFMVEMSEVAAILQGATKRSFLILDEIGRGTSTADGLAIARAVVEYITDPEKLGARTMFATHYHELTQLEGVLPGVVNYCSTVREKEDGVVFLHRIARGSADKSYGIQVAKIAGVPEEILKRAQTLADQITFSGSFFPGESLPERDEKEKQAEEGVQMSLFDTGMPDPLVEKLKETDVNRMTPIDALKLLYEMCEEAGRRS